VSKRSPPLPFPGSAAILAANSAGETPALPGGVNAYVRDGFMDTEAGCELKAQLDRVGYEIPEPDLALWKFLGQRAGSFKA